MVDQVANLAGLLRRPRIAYFSMEIALADEIPTYSGGLGVLAGDTVRTAADMELPMVAVTLVSRNGFFRQGFSEAGEQLEHPDPWQPSEHAKPLRAMVAVPIEGHDVWLRSWLYVHESPLGSRVPVVLLDTDCESNGADDRRITDDLYGGDTRHRLKQEIVLGIGGLRMLQAVGVAVEHYHMNEGHSALLAWGLARHYAYPPESLRRGESPYDFPRVRNLCTFTTHTPVEAGHDRFPYPMVKAVLGGLTDEPTLQALAGEDSLNMTRLALNLSEYVNGVAKRHAEVSRQLFPGYRLHAITNGVHPHTWTARPLSELFDAHMEGWAHEPEKLRRAQFLPTDELAAARRRAKEILIARVRRDCGVELDPDLPILGFGRRMTAYKRPDLLFQDMDRLRAIAAERPFQVVFGGKAHPNDAEGKRLIRWLHEQIEALRPTVPMAFLPGYGMDTARHLVAGADVWLNTPLPPLEASGTSGMKAAFNGVPSLSVLDGWWLEGWIEGITGWAVGDGSEDSDGDDADCLYRKLAETVLPLYHDNPEGWADVMRNAIALNASSFNTYRMMRRYATEAYLS